MKDPIKLAHLVSHPIQYFAPLYRELARRREVDLTVFFYSDVSMREFHDFEFGLKIEWDVPLLDGYRYVFCPSARNTPIDGSPLARRNLDIVRELHRFDVIWAQGYAHLTAWMAFLATRWWRKEFIVRDDPTLIYKRSALRRAAKAAFLPFLFRNSWGLYVGKENRRYCEHYRMRRDRMFPARHAVDNSFFMSAAHRLKDKKTQLRSAFGLRRDLPVVLFCGKLIEKKRPLVLAEAFRRVRQRTPCSLLLVGDGSLRPDIEHALSGVPDVAFAGFMNQTEIPMAYSAADLLVLPSVGSETWGLTVNEAMCFGLPIIVSDQVGCAADLVDHGRNGFVVPHDDIDAFSTVIEALVVDPDKRAGFGTQSLEIVKNYSIEACADGIVAACMYATGHSNHQLVAHGEVTE